MTYNEPEQRLEELLVLGLGPVDVLVGKVMGDTGRKSVSAVQFERSTPVRWPRHSERGKGEMGRVAAAAGPPLSSTQHPFLSARRRRAHAAAFLLQTQACSQSRSCSA